MSSQTKNSDTEFLLSVIEEFQMTNPSISNINLLVGMEIMKALFHKNQFCSLNSHSERIPEDKIVFINDAMEFKKTFNKTLKFT